MPDTHTRKAYMAIEDDLLQIHSAAAVLHLACGNLEDRGEAALLRSLHFTATSIETALERIEAKLHRAESEGEDA
jgi:hypothetical protein